VSARVALATLGCRLNQVDTQEIQAGLEARGFVTVPGDGRADVVVVNTCTVTARAEFSDRQAIRRARRGNPQARVVVTGCWAQTSPADVARVGGVDLVVGNADKHRLPELVAGLLAAPTTPSHASATDLARARLRPPAPPASSGGRSRAFVKVQDGCQHRCAFCIVPFARGASRSVEPDALVTQVHAMVEAGHAEVVLTGIDLGHYGADLTPRTTLAALRRTPDAIALVSVPGANAFVEAMDAVESGHDVMVFSDNVPVEHELALKTVAAERDLLVMGPDCGTAVVGGVGLGFANA